MKKVLAIAILLVALTFVLVAMASAQTQPAWRLYITADDGANGNYISGTTAATAATGKDGYGVDGVASDSNDNKYVFTTPTTPKSIAFVFGDKLWKNDVQSLRAPSNPAYAPTQEKIWNIRAFGYGSAATETPIRIKFNTVSSTVQPPLVLPNGPAAYTLKMVDNKGVAGAPANGTVWTVPVPVTGLAANTMFFSITLPTINLSLKTDAAAIAEGYALQFIQTEPVPEPSSLLALGAGLMGLAGFASRRRRS